MINIIKNLLLFCTSVFRSDFSKNKKEFNFSYDYHWNEYGHYIVANQIEKSNFLTLD